MADEPALTPQMPLTVELLRAMLWGLPGDMWVILDGHGPAWKILPEPHANEPFVIIQGRSDE